MHVVVFFFPPARREPAWYEWTRVGDIRGEAQAHVDHDEATRC